MIAPPGVSADKSSFFAKPTLLREEIRRWLPMLTKQEYDFDPVSGEELQALAPTVVINLHKLPKG